MFSALTYDKPLAGIVALSSWLPLHNILQEVMFHEFLMILGEKSCAEFGCFVADRFCP